jgi:hypothetical protein
MRQAKFGLLTSALMLGLVRAAWAASTHVGIPNSTWNAWVLVTGDRCAFDAGASINVIKAAGAHPMEGWGYLAPSADNPYIPPPNPTNHCGEVHLRGQSSITTSLVFHVEGVLAGDTRTATGGSAPFEDVVVDYHVTLRAGQSVQQGGTFGVHTDVKNVQWKYFVSGFSGQGGPWSDYANV